MFGEQSVTRTKQCCTAFYIGLLLRAASDYAHFLMTGFQVKTPKVRAFRETAQKKSGPIAAVSPQRSRGVRRVVRGNIVTL
jgi:hypothetical protein